MSLTWPVSGLGTAWNTLGTLPTSFDKPFPKSAAIRELTADQARLSRSWPAMLPHKITFKGWVRGLFIVGSYMLSAPSKPVTNNQQRAHIGLRSFVRTRHYPASGDTRNRRGWPPTCITGPNRHYPALRDTRNIKLLIRGRHYLRLTAPTPVFAGRGCVHSGRGPSATLCSDRGTRINFGPTWTPVVAFLVASDLQGGSSGCPPGQPTIMSSGCGSPVNMVSADATSCRSARM